MYIVRACAEFEAHHLPHGCVIKMHYLVGSYCTVGLYAYYNSKSRGPRPDP